jgi:hypothetical protein
MRHNWIKSSSAENQKAGFVAFLQLTDSPLGEDCQWRDLTPQLQQRQIVEDIHLMQVQRFVQRCVPVVASDSKVDTVPVE